MSDFHWKPPSVQPTALYTCQKCGKIEYITYSSCTLDGKGICNPCLNRSIEESARKLAAGETEKEE